MWGSLSVIIYYLETSRVQYSYMASSNIQKKIDSLLIREAVTYNLHSQS